MSAVITITCSHCGQSCTDDLRHVMDWDDRHDALCPKRPTTTTTEDQP